MVVYESIERQDLPLAAVEADFCSGMFSETNEPSVFLKTCNRMELYYGDGEVSDEVANHLFRVASGLESVLIGERAVQGQVRDAYLSACKRYRLSAGLHKLFEYALQTGKRVRTETEISKGAVSHSLAAIELISESKVDLSKAHITIIGVNKLTDDILKFLRNKGAKTVFLANRSEEKAREIAGRHGAEVCRLSEKCIFLPQTDILITATSAPHTIIDVEDVRPDQRLMVIDLAFPRDVNPLVGELPYVTLYNIRDVERRVQRNIFVRKSEVAKAEHIIEEGIAGLQAVLKRRRFYVGI
ncbi:MAG: glutamyl-tRNA reductase [Bacteroidales bacterium]|nr:glutamyl-tRNA reductase [Bacteroidales bacterium]